MTSPTLSFDGTDDYVQTTFPADFGTGPFTVCGWINVNTLPSGRYSLLSTYNGTNGIIFGPVGYPGGDWRLWVSGNTAIGGASNTGVWYHITGVRQSDGSLELYLDGELIATGSSTSDVTNSSDMHIGADPEPSSLLDGALDDVRVFDTALTQEQIQSVMNGHVIESEVAHYPMNEGSGSTCSDATTNNNSGTINSATWSSRSGGTTYDWQTNTDWNSRQSQTNVVHNENLKLGIDGDEYVEIGQQTGQFGDGDGEAYYSISSIDSTTVYDNSAADNNSTTVSGTTKVEENNTRFPQSLSFDGTDDYVELPTSIQDTTSIVGTELWFYPRSTGAQYLVYFHDFYGLLFDLNGNQQLYVNTFGDVTSLGPTNIALDTWHHCNFYWDIGTEVGISVDGGTWDTYATTHTPSNQSDVSYLGVNGYSAVDYFDGKLTELRFVADQRIDRAESFYQNQGTLTTARKS